MRVIAIPVKSLSRTKLRLAGLLSPVERAALTLAMLEDVLDAALAIQGWETWVISPDEAVLEIAARRRARPVAEEKPPLSSALRQVETEAADQDALALAVLLADLPLLSSTALTRALHTLGPVVIAPSHSDGGTNLLLRRPPRSVPSRFGRNSLQKHVDGARIRGLPVAVVDDEALRFDLDDPRDVGRFVELGEGRRSLDVCLELEVLDRLTARTR